MGLYGQTFSQEKKKSGNMYGQTFNPDFIAPDPLPLERRFSQPNTAPLPSATIPTPLPSPNPIIGENLFLDNALPIRQNDNPIIKGLKGIVNFGASTLAAPGEVLRKLSLEGGSLLTGNGLKELPNNTSFTQDILPKGASDAINSFAQNHPIIGGIGQMALETAVDPTAYLGSEAITKAIKAPNPIELASKSLGKVDLPSLSEFNPKPNEYGFKLTTADQRLRNLQQQGLENVFGIKSTPLQPLKISPLQQNIDEAIGKRLTPAEISQNQIDAKGAFGRDLNNFKLKERLTPEQIAHNSKQAELNDTFGNAPIGSVDTPATLNTLQSNIDKSLGIGRTTGDYQGLDAFMKLRESKKYNLTASGQKAFDALQQGIKDAQEFLGGNKLVNDFSGEGFTPEASLDNIKHYTGIDLPQLVQNWEKTQISKTSLTPERLSMGRTAGVIPPLKQRNMINSELPIESPRRLGLSGTLPENIQSPIRPNISLKPRESSLPNPLIEPRPTNGLPPLPKFSQPGPEVRPTLNRGLLSDLPKTNTDIPLALKDAGPLPIKSITEENLGKLPGQLNAPLKPPIPIKRIEQPVINNQGVGMEIIEPKLSMSLQRFGIPTTNLPDTMSHIISKTERQPMSLDTLTSNAYIKTTDNFHRLNQLDKYVEDTIGRKLSPEDKSYMLALNSRGAGSTTSHILEENLVNPQGEVIGDSLKTITSQLKNKQMAKEFDDYLVNKHAITRMKLGEKVYPDEMKMTPEISEAKVRQYEELHPEFKDLSNKLYEFQNKLAKAWLVDSGIVPPEAYGKWIIDNPNYVPNNRLFSEMEKTSFGGAKREIANQSNPVKARTTSQRKVISPLESIMEHADQYVKVARRNEVMQTVIRNIQKNPEEFKGWGEIIPSDGQLKQGLMSDINKILGTEGIDGIVEQFNKQFDDIFNAKKQRLDLGNIVTGIVDGEKVHVKVNDPLLLDALTNLKPQGQQVVVAALGQVTRVMKNLTTGINPVFGLARNIWRDIPTAFINSKSTNNPLVFGKDLLGSIVDVMGNRELYKSYKAMGGGHASSSVSTGRNSLAESKARLLPGYALKHPFKAAIGSLERLNNAVETAPRLGEYKRISKPGDYSSKVKGIYESNDVTTNFNKFGNVIKEADSIFPYLNAAWQGIDKLARTFRDNPVQASAKALVAVTIPSILLYQQNHNDPAYQQLSDYIKDNNFLISKGDGTFIKIPKPREVGVMFGSSVERAMRQWQDNDPDAFNRFSETIKTNFLPPVTRTIVAPLSDIRANKNFMGAPIVSGSVSKLYPPLQFDEKTSEPAKKLGKVLNQSPQQIDYLARSYLGGVAQLGLPALTKNASVGGVLKKQITADPIFSNDIISDFYNTLNKIDTSASSAKATGDKSLELGKNYKPLFNKASGQLGDIRKQIDKIQASPLPNEQKDDKIRTMQIQMLAIAKKANDTFKLK